MEKIKILQEKEEKFDILKFAQSLENKYLEPQQQIGAISYVLLRKRAEELGEKIKEFDSGQISTFNEWQDNSRDYFDVGQSEGVYDSDLNIIALESAMGTSLSKMTHEMAHLFTDQQNIACPIVNIPRRKKSGFGAYYKPKSLNEDSPAKQNFLLLNEGITELLAHDLCSDFTRKKFGDLYTQVFPKQAQLSKAASIDFNNNYKIILDDELEVEKNRIIKISDPNQKQDEEKWLDNKTKYNEKAKKRGDSNLKNSLELVFNGNNPLFDKYKVGYAEMVSFVGSLLDGLALEDISQQKNIPSFEVVREHCWRDMQKSYFRGNTVYLRILERVYGSGFLEKISSLDYKDVQINYEEKKISWNQFEEVKKLVEEKNNEMWSKLFKE